MHEGLGKLFLRLVFLPLVLLAARLPRKLWNAVRRATRRNPGPEIAPPPSRTKPDDDDAGVVRTASFSAIPGRLAAGAEDENRPSRSTGFRNGRWTGSSGSLVSLRKAQLTACQRPLHRSKSSSDVSSVASRTAPVTSPLVKDVGKVRREEKPPAPPPPGTARKLFAACGVLARSLHSSSLVSRLPFAPTLSEFVYDWLLLPVVGGTLLVMHHQTLVAL